MHASDATNQMKPWLWFLLAIAVAAISWSYSHRILIPWDFYVNQQRNGLKEDMGDLYARWVGTRELMLHGKNPYSAEVSHEIQMGFYGHIIEQSYDNSRVRILDEQRFVYPIYVVFLLAPAVHADFSVLNVWAPAALALFTAISIWLWLDVVRWKPPFLSIVAVSLFVLSSPQLAQGLRLRQLGLFVAFLLALASWSLVRQRYFLAGIPLALATIKPQMMILCLAWFLLWMSGDWKKRWPLGLGFGISMAALAGAGELLVPGWPRDFIVGLAAYRKYFPTTSCLRMLLGNWIGWPLSFILLIFLFVYAWHKRQAETTSAEFLHVLAVFFVASALILPLLAPYNQVLLLLPLMILLRDWGQLSKTIRWVFIAVVAWHPVTALALLVRPPRLDSFTPLPLLPSAMVFVFVALFLFMPREQPV